MRTSPGESVWAAHTNTDTTKTRNTLVIWSFGTIRTKPIFRSLKLTQTGPFLPLLGGAGFQSGFHCGDRFIRMVPLWRYIEYRSGWSCTGREMTTEVVPFFRPYPLSHADIVGIAYRAGKSDTPRGVVSRQSSLDSIGYQCKSEIGEDTPLLLPPL